jgi:hypothetical protein
MQELRHPSMTKAFSKANKAAKSSQETRPPIEGLSESLEVHSDWHTQFMMYLRTGGLPDDKYEYEQLRRQAGHYALVNDELFR